MKILFRTDASVQIGAGHVSRCLVLAENLRGQGAKCTFVCRDLQGHLGAEITARGFELIMLPAGGPAETHADATRGRAQYADWLGADPATDVAQTLDAGGESGFDWCVVDHYAIGEDWERAIRRSCRHVLVIDDLCDRPHDCDLLLNQNFGKSHEARYRQMVGEKPHLLLGPHFALLRGGFATARRIKADAPGEDGRIFVCMGGMDAGNLTAGVIDVLVQSGCAGPRVDVVVGGKHPNIQMIEEKCGRHGVNFHIQPSDLVQLMASSSLAIGTSGVMSWERCCLGLPSIAMAVADNQIEIGEELANAGAAVFLGKASPDALASLGQKVLDLMSEPGLLDGMSAAASGLVDGGGAARVTRFMVGENENFSHLR